MSKYEMLLSLRKTNSITKTAKEYAYTPSAVSQALRSYEAAIGVKLFNKTRNGMEETPEAKDILDAIEKICVQEKAISDRAIQLNNLKEGHLRIGCIQSISYHWLPQILNKFHLEYPDITFEIIVDGFKELSRKLENHELECIYTSEYAAPEFNFIPMTKDELLLVTPRDHELSNKLSLSIEQVDGYEFVVSSDGMDYETGELFDRKGIKTKCTFALDDDYSTLKMVEAGVGISILPNLLLTGAPFDVCIRPFSEHYNRVLGIAHRSGETLVPALEKLVEYSVEWAKFNTR